MLAEVKLAPCPERHADPKTKVYPVSITGYLQLIAKLGVLFKVPAQYLYLVD